MKKIKTLVFTSIISIHCFAQTQLTNSSFETWKPLSDNITIVPTDWSPPAACGQAGGPLKCTSNTSRETESSEGKYAAKTFTSKSTDGQVSYGTFSNLFNGWNGQAFVGRPTSISMDLKFFTSENNELKIGNNIYKTPTDLFDNNLVMIASADSIFTTIILSASTYTTVTIPVKYSSNLTPSHSFLKFDFKNKPTVGGDFFFVDNVRYNYGPTGLADEELVYSNKKLVRVFTSAGIEIAKENAIEGLFIFQYKDGSVKKVMIQKY